MAKDQPTLEPDQMLPWYAAHALPTDDRRTVDAWLEEHPEANAELEVWRQVRSAALDQPQVAPSLGVKRQMLARLQADRLSRARQIRFARLAGTAIALAVLFTLWAIVQPGIALQWSVSGNGAQAYRIYRAVTGSNDFQLLQVLPSRPDSAAYSYTDVSSMPGQTYTYRVEVVAEYGEPVASQTVNSNGLDVLPAQLALVVTSLLAGYAVTYAVSHHASLFSTRRTLTT